MPYKVTRRLVVSNDVLMPEVTSDTIPEAGWQYHDDGVYEYEYAFTTWRTKFDTHFPPLITETGTIKTTYWYRIIGGPGDGPTSCIVTCCAMFLGDATEDAFFNTNNPIDKVNGAAWTGDRSVSTENGPLDIVARAVLTKGSTEQEFKQWIPLYGNCTALGDHLTVGDHVAGTAVAVYGAREGVGSGIHLHDLESAIRQVVDKKDLVADFLDEARRYVIEAIASGEPKTASMLAEAVREVKEQPTAVATRLVEVRTEMRRLEAVEKILKSLLQKR